MQLSRGVDRPWVHEDRTLLGFVVLVEARLPPGHYIIQVRRVYVFQMLTVDFRTLVDFQMSV